MRGMFTFHGFGLDTGIIGILPFVSKEASNAQRVEKFPWALGGLAAVSATTFEPLRGGAPTPPRTFMRPNRSPHRRGLSQGREAGAYPPSLHD